MRVLVSFLLALLSHVASMRVGVEVVNRRAALMGAGSAMLAIVAPAVADGRVAPSLARTAHDTNIRHGPRHHSPSTTFGLTPAHLGSRLSKDDQAGIAERSRTGKLQTNKALERARANTMFDSKDAACVEITNIIEVDTRALGQETELLKSMQAVLKKSQTKELQDQINAEIVKVQQIDKRLEKTILSLKNDEAVKCGLY